MTAGSSVGALLAWALTNSLLAFYALWAVIGLLMATVLYEPAFGVVAVWFDRQRARALTALTLIAGFSSTVFLPLAAWLALVQGWRSALGFDGHNPGDRHDSGPRAAAATST